MNRWISNNMNNKYKNAKEAFINIMHKENNEQKSSKVLYHAKRADIHMQNKKIFLIAGIVTAEQRCSKLCMQIETLTPTNYVNVENKFATMSSCIGCNRNCLAMQLIFLMKSSQTDNLET